MADKIGFKQRNCHLGPNLRLLETDFFKKWISVKLNAKKAFQYVMCHGNSHLLLKYPFRICLCSMLISLSKIVSEYDQEIPQS